MFILELPDVDNERAGMRAAVPCRNIRRLRGTKAYQSLVDRALKGNERNLAAMMSYGSSPDAQWEKSDTASVTVRQPERRHHTGEPNFVEEMMLLDKELRAIIKNFAPFVKRQYGTLEQAAEVSRRLTQDAADRLLGAGIANWVLGFEGEYALKASSLEELPEERISPGEFFLRLDAEQPFKRLQHGDNFQGTFHAFLGDVHEVIDEDGDTIAYQPLPRLIVDVSSNTTNMLTYKELPMIEIEARQRGMIPLDGSVVMTLPSLERYKSDKEARHAASVQYGRDPIVREIHDLFAALYNESDQGYQELGHPERIRSIARRIDQNDLEAGSTTALQALESLFVGRSVMVTGDTYTQDGTLEENGFSDGIVGDVRTDTPLVGTSGPLLVVLDKNHGEYRYVKMSTIATLAF